MVETSWSEQRALDEAGLSMHQEKGTAFLPQLLSFADLSFTTDEPSVSKNRLFKDTTDYEVEQKRL